MQKPHNICKKVTLIHRRDKLRAEKILQDRMFEKKNIVGAGFIINLPDLNGDKKLQERGVKIHSLMDF